MSPSDPPLTAALLRWSLPVCLTAVLLAPIVNADGLMEVTEAAASLGALVFAGLTLLWCRFRGAVPIRAPAAFVCIAAILGVVLLQFVPVGDLLGRLSPETAELKSRTAASVDGPLAPPEPPTRVAGEDRTRAPAARADAIRRQIEYEGGDAGGTPSCLSLNPGAGRDETIRLLVGVIFFTAALWGPADRGHLRRILILLTALGGVLAYLTLLRKIDAIGDKVLFWLDLPDPSGGGVLHSDGNRNRLAGLLNVGIGAGFGLLLELLTAPVRTLGSAAPRAASDGSEAPPRNRLILLLPALVGMTGAVFVTLSRGASLALAAALAATVAALLSRRGKRSLAGIPAVAALGALALVTWFGFLPKIEARLQTLGDSEKVEESRLRLWRDTLAMSAEFPAFGIGWGCYRSVFPAFRTIPGSVVFTHAENEYLHVLAELGLAGALPAAVLLALVLRAVWQCGRAALDGNGLAAGPAFAAITVLVASAADFGFHGPSNGFLYVLVVALCLQQAAESGSAGASRTADGAPEAGGPRGGRIALLLIPALAAGGWWMIGVQLDAAAAARHMEMFDTMGVSRLPDMGAEQRAAVTRLRPDDALLQTRLGTAMYMAAADEFGPHRAGADGPVFRAAERHYRRGAAGCPAYGRPVLGLGRLYELVHDPRAGPLLEEAERLAPVDPEVRMYRARWFMHEARPEDALAAYVRAAELDGSYLPVLLDALPAICANPAGTLHWPAHFTKDEIRRRVAEFLAGRGRVDEAESLWPKLRRGSAGDPAR